MFSIESKGSFSGTESFLKNISKSGSRITSVLNSYGRVGVAALSSVTQIRTGIAAHSWGSTVSNKGGVYEISWTNSDVENGFPVVIMLQYGHGTGTGGYVSGYDYINPAIRPVFDLIATQVWKAVTSA